MIRCPECGHEAPEGSAFCNHCGAKLALETECPYCHSIITTDSVFCPNCGKLVREPQAATDREVTQQTTPPHYKAQSPTRDPWQQQQNIYARNNHEQNLDDENDTSDEPSHYNRNLLIGVVLAALLIGLLTLMRHCNSQSDRRAEAQADSVAVASEDSQDPLAIFNAELSRNNMTGDDAIAALAVKFPSEDPENPERIVGVTYKNDADRPFIKIYRLSRSGSLWQPELVQTKYFERRTINPDNSALIADINTVPRRVNLDGNEYLYFAFVNSLQGADEGNSGRVTLCLFDIDSKKLSTLNYDGPIKRRNDGRLYIYGKPLESANSSERRFLRQEADKLKVLYVPTEEELKAEEEARLKAEEEKALAGEENADAKWNHDNAETMDKLKEGEEVRINAPQYDKPIFNMKDIASKLENDGYLVFTDNKGAVYGFNKSSRKYFVIFSPSGGNKAIGISFEDSGNLHIKTTNGNISYNLASDKAKHVD